MIAAFELFGRPLPDPKLGIVILVLMVGFYLVSRNGGGAEGNRVGRGRMHRCPRCGREFQIEQVELLSNGDVRHFLDERCPNCGWDLEWTMPKKPGGSSGRW